MTYYSESVTAAGFGLQAKGQPAERHTDQIKHTPSESTLVIYIIAQNCPSAATPAETYASHSVQSLQTVTGAHNWSLRG